MRVRTSIALWLVVFFVLHSNILWGEQVPVEKARRVAVNNFNRITQARALREQELSEDAKAEQQPPRKITEKQITETFTATEKDVLVYYVFNFAPEGWAMISADDVAYPVIGYSLNGLYDPNLLNHPPAFSAWMENVAAEIADAAMSKLKALPEAVDAWKELSVAPADYEPNLAGPKRVESVEPLIQSTWGQGWAEDCWPWDIDGYNEYCPWEYSDWSHICRDYCPTGCVATAMAQIMRYWQWPPFGAGSHGYDPPYEPSHESSGFGWRDVDFSRQTYDWSSMPLNTASNAIARLMRDIGVAMEMNYTPSSSSAYTSHAPNAYGAYFRYNGGEYQSRSSYPGTWSGKLMQELCAGRPIMYRGRNGGGHAFICDGYEDWGASFHFNWGWDGSYDGYFTLDDLTPGTRDYTNNQAAVLGIEPNPYSGPLDVYVDGDYNDDGGNDGHDWHYDAFDNIHDALLVVGLGGTVHVSPGTYYEAIDFQGKAIRLYGTGGPEVTFINGIGCYHVVKCVSGEGPDTILEGFTIAMGRANHPDNFEDMFGGGMLNIMSSPTVKNCIFTDNSADFGGGGMMNDQSNPTVIDCTFTYNSAEFEGGGMANDQSSPTVTNCTFSSNSTTYDHSGNGGGMYNSNESSPTVSNCTFSNNISTVFGGGMTNYYDSNPRVTNCTFSNNHANNGGGIYNYENSATVTNSILWGNTPDEILEIWGTTTVTYSDIKGGWDGKGNIDADPCFVDAGAGNLRLRPGSACIEIGDSSAPDLALTDLDGRPRIIDGDCNGVAAVDMGPYEFNYGYMGDLDYNCAVDFGDLAIFGPAWQTSPGNADYNPACNISDTTDDYIDWRDLAVIAENWLATAW